METPNSCHWSLLPLDILISLFERLSFVDFHRAKIVCRNWYMCSKQTLHKKSGSPWLILFPEDDHGCVVYNPDEARVYKTKRDFSGTRFLSNSGNLFLTLDSVSNLSIIDVFSEKRIVLPPLDSIKGGHISLERVGDTKFREILTSGSVGCTRSVVNLRGLLWVDEKQKEEYTVAWLFVGSSPKGSYIAFCKNGEDHYRAIPLLTDASRWLRGICESDMVLRGSMLYIFTYGRYLRVLDFSGHEGFNDVVLKFDAEILYPASPPSSDNEINYDGAYSTHTIAVTTSGEVLLVERIIYEVISGVPMICFHLYKKSHFPYPDVPEVYSLGDEALFLDTGITVPADHSLGIEPNSIYFTRHDRSCNRLQEPSYLSRDICVFNLETKKLTRFPNISYLKPKDARWFLTS